MTAKKEKRLEKHGYFAMKGKFGYVKKDVSKTKRTRQPRRPPKKVRVRAKARESVKQRYKGNRK